MSHFYLNSSMKCHPTNTAAKYITKLPTAIDLSGEWEVALAEITYPRNFYNVGDDDCYIDVWQRFGRPLDRPTLAKGCYGTISDIVNEIQKQNVAKHFALKYEDKVSIIVDSQKVARLSPTLAHIFGFTKRTLEGGCEDYKNELMPDISAGITSMYVYCDVIESVVVGDSKVQLLRTVPIESGHHTFTNPIYLPIQKKHFDSVEINIMTDAGDPMPFAVGKSVIVLHFRRSSNPYFLLQK